MSASTMESAERVNRSAASLCWIHVCVFGSIALGCYVAPEVAFGESAWLPLSRLSALLFAAALSALVVFLIASARSGTRRQVSLSLLAAVTLDAQIPILAFSQPAALEYLHTGVGIPWFVIPLVFLALVGFTVHALLSLSRRPVEHARLEDVHGNA